MTSSLPDLVTSSQSGRRRAADGGGSFIGGVRDIDSLLGFGETEDELEVKSDDDDDSGDSSSSSSDDSDSAESFATSHERQQQQQDQPRDATSARRTAKSPARHPHTDDSLVGHVDDIDEILGTDLVPSHLGSSSVTERPAVNQTPADSTHSSFSILYFVFFLYFVFCSRTEVKVKGKGRGAYRSLWIGNPSQSCGASPAIWDHTVLPATRHR